MAKDLASAYSVKKSAKKKLSKNHDKNAHLYESDEGTSKQGSKVRAQNRAESWAKDDRSSTPSVERAVAKTYKGEAKEVASDRAEKERKIQPKMQGLAEGGEITESMKRPKMMPLKHPKHVPIGGASLRLRDQEDDLQQTAKVNDGPQEEPPKQDDEMGAKRKGPDVPALHMKKMAEGGRIDSMEQPQPEADEEHHDSIAAAIMAKRGLKRLAEGGAVNGADSIYSDDSDQADLSRNAEEDANMEDQASFDALRKENYSESEGLDALDQPSDSNEHGDSREEDEENKHDKISKMRARMNAKRQFPK